MFPLGSWVLGAPRGRLATVGACRQTWDEISLPRCCEGLILGWIDDIPWDWVATIGFYKDFQEMIEMLL